MRIIPAVIFFVACMAVLLKPYTLPEEPKLIASFEGLHFYEDSMGGFYVKESKDYAQDDDAELNE